ncbi:hypothetical protein JYB88_02820 [Shewanella cyperi]|uniref:Ig-like domain-containing protein n=1 Tax=Shewanella cyperi TaxID=2814292 RepID=A0A974XNP3_9GAMM|nr:hypothetical protein [Shewanella cyperi]QSX30613.1 hypothetical protein JYB88_02820 [Shewanella cyperi]
MLVFTLTACGRHHHKEAPVDVSALSIPVTLNTVRGSQEGIPLTWSSVETATSYAVYRCEVPDGVTQDLVAAAPIDNCGDPIAITTELSFTDLPPLTAPQAYVYHLRACADLEAQVCGSVIASIAASQAIPADIPQMTTNIGDDGRQVISGLTTTLHAFAHDAVGPVSWSWTQESGPKVTLTGADTSVLTFTAPTVTINTLLSFELRTQDDNGIGRPSKVAVTVVPANNVSVKAGATSRLVQAGHEVFLHARGSDSNLTYEWRQISPDSPVVTLNNANTANPSFIAPSIPQGGVLHFDVTVTDPVTGKNASARTAIQVQYAVPTLTPILEPSQTPDPVPTPIPIAAPLLMPLQIAQPLQVPQPLQLVPSPSPVLVPPKVPPQALVLLAPPVVTATGGTSVQLGMTASGGQEPYQWDWIQTGGPAATLLDSTQEVVTVELPSVDSAQALTFQASLIDAEGNERTAEAVVHATLPPGPASGATPTPITPLEPRLVVVNETVPVMSTPLTDVTVTQTSGPELQISQQSNGGDTGTQISVTAPLLKDNSAHATLTVTGKDPKGQPLHYVVPILIMRPLPVIPAPEAPPQVLPPQQVPKQDDPLVIIGGVTGVIVNEGSTRGLAVAVQGGKGRDSYRYLWSYLKDDDGPDITLHHTDTARMIFTAPGVDRPTLLRFNVQITDGAQTIQRDGLVQVNDVSASLVVGALAPITVDSGQSVSISAPEPTGGIQFPTRDHYRYAIAQVLGTPTVTLTPTDDQADERASHWTFIAPTLAPGAADAVLQFELTSRDRVENTVKTTQEVIVKAPPLPSVPPLVPNLSVPVSIALGAPITLQADASGGTPPYTFEWLAHPEVVAIAGRSSFNLPDLTATGQNPTLSPDNLGTRRGDAADYRLKLTLKVTDANLQTAETKGEVQVVLMEANRPGTVALLCGKLATNEPCTDLELVLGQTKACPDDKPYAMNQVNQINRFLSEYRYCVDAITAFNLFVVGGSKDNPLCRHYDPAASSGSITCYLACYGDDCNIDTNPPDSTLVGPVGSDGLLSIGLPPLTSSSGH